MSRTRHRRRYPAGARARLATARPRLEGLEDRTVLSAASSLGSSLFDRLALDPTTYDGSRILVRFRDAGSTPLALPTGAHLGSSYGVLPGLRSVTLDTGLNVVDALKAFQALPGVADVSPDYRVRALLTPDDARYPSAWGLNNTGQGGGTIDADIDAPEAWDRTTGSSSVVVAVSDTGIDYTHPDLRDNMWRNPGEVAGNGIDDDHNGYVDDVFGYDFFNNDPDPMDDHGHGTHVAGIIGAKGNNSLGVVGVNWNVKLMALKFLGTDGTGTLSGAIAALNYAVAMGASVSNNSWGGGGASDLYRQALVNASAAGHIFVAAAGNESSNNDTRPSYPASYNIDNVIAVAATDNRDRLASFSNYGATSVHLGAPGVEILSTVPRNGAVGDPSGYTACSGASMAAAHVTGVVALVKSLHPEWSARQVINQVLATADPVPALQGRTITGGRVNAAAAVGGAAADRSGPQVTAHSPAGAVNGPVSSVRLTFNEAIAPASFTPADIVSFTGPAGPISLTGVSVSEVPSSNGLAFDISFPSQSATGDYALVIGPQVLDLEGNPMDQNHNGTNGEVPGDRYTARFSLTDRTIFVASDVPRSFASQIISLLAVDRDLTIADIDVQLSVGHPRVGRLSITLVSPHGTTVTLVGPIDRPGADYQYTIFDDEAVTSISSGTAPFLGSYRPLTPLSAVDGQNARGTWQLVINNTVPTDPGELDYWALHVAAVSNRPPIAQDDDASTRRDVPVTVPVLANDSDPDGDPLTVTIEQQHFGTAQVNADQTVTFTPAAGFVGTAGFVYRVSDGRGGSDTASVSVEVAPVNRPPQPQDDTAWTPVDTPLVLGGPGPWVNILANDSDPDGDRLHITAVSNATRGSVRLNPDGTVTFTPEPGFTGTAGFDYTVSDGSLTATAHVTVGVRQVIYVSTANAGTLTGSDGQRISVTGSDIVRVATEGTGSGTRVFYDVFFRGANVGLTTANENIDAFTFLSDGSLLISTTNAFSVPGPAGSTITGGGEDILRFLPTAYGATTAGSWQFYFDGSDVGLSGASENIDALAVLPDGRFLISTAGNVSVPGVTAADTDLLAFGPATLGSATSGIWSFYFDGSDVGLSDNTSEDMDGLFVQVPLVPGPITVYLSTRGGFAVPGVSGASEDIVSFRPTSLGPTTAGSFGPGLRLRGSTVGLAPLGLDGFWLGAAPPLSMTPTSGLPTGGLVFGSHSGLVDPLLLLPPTTPPVQVSGKESAPPSSAGKGNANTPVGVPSTAGSRPPLLWRLGITTYGVEVFLTPDGTLVDRFRGGLKG